MGMLAAQVTCFHPDDPLAGLRVGDHPEPEEREHWTRVHVRAAALNQHDLWSLRGVGLRAEQLPMVLGTDAAGVTDDGREVVVHAVVGGGLGHGVGPTEPRSLLSERYPGTLAEQVSVPTWNLVDKPAGLSLVIETVGAATWSHSVRSVRPGGTIVVAGATTGDPARAELQRIFFQEIAVLGVTMGSKQDLTWLLAFCERTGVRPVVDSTVPLARVGAGLARLARGEQFGKVVAEV